MVDDYKIKIYAADGQYKTIVYGNKLQCLANVGEGETFEEITELVFEPLKTKGPDAREVKIKMLTVESGIGNVFDADERSQERMARAVMVMTQQNVNTTKWKLANNNVIDATLEELKDVLTKASTATSDIWLNT